jgi:hypothetical protein
MTAMCIFVLTTGQFIIEEFILRQVYSLFHSEFFARCNLVLSLSNSSYSPPPHLMSSFYLSFHLYWKSQAFPARQAVTHQIFIQVKSLKQKFYKKNKSNNLHSETIFRAILYFKSNERNSVEPELLNHSYIWEFVFLIRKYSKPD